MSYLTQPLTESQCQALDNGESPAGPSLFQMGKNPATAEILLKVRGLKTRERWAELAQDTDLMSEEDRRIVGLVWETLPGTTCLMDAIRLIAFGPRSTDSPATAP